MTDVTRADLYRTLSHALMRTGDAERCVEAADEALRIAEPLGLELIIAEALNNKGSALGYLGRPRECLALMRGAVEVARLGRIRRGRDPGPLQSLGNRAGHA